MKQSATYYFNNGYSCSESIIKWAIDEGFFPQELLACATPFSAGMSSGCVCGAISGSQIVLGYNFGRENNKNNENVAREKAFQFVEEFKKRNQFTCCKILTKDVTNRKEHCSKMVADCAEILESMLKVRV